MTILLIIITAPVVLFLFVLLLGSLFFGRFLFGRFFLFGSDRSSSYGFCFVSRIFTQLLHCEAIIMQAVLEYSFGAGLFGVLAVAIIYRELAHEFTFLNIEIIAAVVTFPLRRG